MGNVEEERNNNRCSASAKTPQTTAGQQYCGALLFDLQYIYNVVLMLSNERRKIFIKLISLL